MNFHDATELTEQLAKTCEIPGLLAKTWGTHSLSGEGAVRPDAPLTQFERDQQFDSYVRKQLPPMLRRCEPFFVDRDLIDLIERAAPTLPNEVRLSPKLFKSSYGCLFFERTIDMPPRRLADVPGHPSHEPAPLSGFAWQQDAQGVVLVFFFSWAVDTSNPSWFQGTYVGNIPLSAMGWDFSKTTLGAYIGQHTAAIRNNPEELDTNNAQRFEISARTAVATLLLMDQVLTVIDTVPVERHARKRAAKAGWKGAQTVQVVKLRRVERFNLYEHTRDVTWSCRWTVASHWRVLHRGTPDERTVLVHEHIKGPADKPIKPPNKRVWAVVR